MGTTDKSFYVYLYLREQDSANGMAGSPYYVGKGKGRRAHSRNRVGIAVPKDRSRIVFPARDVNEADAFQAEMLLIRRWGRIDLGTGCLRNRTDGGEGASGLSHSEATRKKLAAQKVGNTYGRSHKGRKMPIASRVKMSQSLRGRRLTSEHKERIRTALEGHAVSEKTRISAGNRFRGRKLSEEHREKLSKSHRDRSWSEARRKAQEARAGQPYKNREYRAS